MLIIFFLVGVENMQYPKEVCMPVEYTMCDYCCIFNNVQTKGMLSPNYVHIIPEW